MLSGRQPAVVPQQRVWCGSALPTLHVVRTCTRRAAVESAEEFLNAQNEMLASGMSKDSADAVVRMVAVLQPTNLILTKLDELQTKLDAKLDSKLTLTEAKLSGEIKALDSKLTLTEAKLESKLTVTEAKLSGEIKALTGDQKVFGLLLVVLFVLSAVLPESVRSSLFNAIVRKVGG